MNEPEIISYIDKLATEAEVAVAMDPLDAGRAIRNALCKLALHMTEQERRWIAQQRFEMNAHG